MERPQATVYREDADTLVEAAIRLLETLKSRVLEAPPEGMPRIYVDMLRGDYALLDEAIEDFRFLEDRAPREPALTLAAPEAPEARV